MRMAVLSMVPSDAYKLLGVLVAIWQTRFVLAVMILLRFLIMHVDMCKCMYIFVLFLRCEYVCFCVCVFC